MLFVLGNLDKMHRTALLLAIVVATGEVRGQSPQPAYPAAPTPAGQGAAFTPPDAHLPQTAAPLVAMQPPGLMQPPATIQPTLGPQPALYSQTPYVSPLSAPAYNMPPAAPGPYPQYPPQYPPMQYPPQYGGPALPSGPLPSFTVPISSRFWFSVDVLMWWTKSAPMPQPLVTLGSPSDSVPGALGQPGTQVIYGGNSIDMRLSAGLRFDTGFWIDNDRQYGVDAGYFFLGRQFRGFSAFSDGYGSPLIARPTFDAQTGTESSYVDSYPGYVTGGITILNRSQFQGANIGPMLNLVQTDRFRFDGLLSFRYLNLTESLNIADQYADVQPGSLTFGGQTIHMSDFLSDLDTFRTTNSFYGGALGGRMNWASGRWLINATGRVGLGTVQERAVIQGSTTLTTAAGTQSILPGGILATTANIGNYYRSPFAVAPEAYLNIGYQITPRTTLRIGYSFIFLSNVLRPGNQVNRTTSANLLPSDPTYGNPGPNLPTYQFHTSSYWAQGLNLGLDWRF
jgi:hypothetical protein